MVASERFPGGAIFREDPRIAVGVASNTLNLLRGVPTE
jgi:hypothetical protein